MIVQFVIVNIISKVLVHRGIKILNLPSFFCYQPYDIRFTLVVCPFI